jgi:hypothetical protein
MYLLTLGTILAEDPQLNLWSSPSRPWSDAVTTSSS